MEVDLKHLQTDFYSFFLYICDDIQKDNAKTCKWEEEFCDFLQYEAYYKYLSQNRVLATLEQAVQHGKFLEGDTPILTKTGWKKHKDLKVGDYVFGDDGKLKKVLWNSGVYKWNVEKIKFSNNYDCILAAKEHLWKIQIATGKRKTINGKKVSVGRSEKIVETQDIFKGYHDNKPAINISPSLKLEKADLPIDPYLLGLWLADGDCADSRITCGWQDIEGLTEILLNRKQKFISKIKQGRNYSVRIENLRTLLRKNNLLNNKHIPLNYILASEEQRLELLNGLMDGDGCVNDRCNCEFTQKAGKLAGDVYLLLRTLGIKPIKHTYRCKLYGKDVGQKVRICFNVDKGQKIFCLRRKQKKIDEKTQKDRDDKKRFFIEKIENYGVVEGNCIEVEDGMYLAGYDLVPTHNSTKLRIFVCWLIGHHSDLSFNFYTASEKLSFETADFIRNILQSRKYKAIFGDVVLKAVQDEVKFHKKGKISYRLMGEGNTGYPSHFSFIDDPYRNSDDAYSPTMRARIENRFRADIFSRRQTKSMVVVLHSRWHCDDLIGIIKKGKEFKELLVSSKHPAINDKGEALFPELRDINFLLEQKKILGSINFNALYQQEPLQESGNIIKKEWLQFYDELPIKYDKLDIYCDTAFTEDGDYSVCLLGGWVGNKIYCVDCIYGKWIYPELKRNLLAFYNKSVVHHKLNSINVYIENKASGQSLIQDLPIPCIELYPTTTQENKHEKRANKYQRLMEVIGTIEAKCLHLPSTPTDWSEELLHEITSFTGQDTGIHDDFVDVVIYLLKSYGKLFGESVDWESINQMF
jgi:predicted phage terminase large subunit-like protein